MEKVKIAFVNLNHQEIEVIDLEKPVIFNLGAAGVDWMQACGQKGRCTTCAFETVEGAENLSELTEAELKFRELGRLPVSQRLACQATTKGNIKIRTPHSSKLPHLEYRD